MSIFERLFTKSLSHNATPVRKRQLRLETLESRELLSVNPALVQEVQAAYADLNLSGDYNVIEITANELSVTNLRAAIASAGTTPENDLIVLRTTATQNKITLDDKELGLGFLGVGINAIKWGSVTIVSLGTNSLTLDAKAQSQIFFIGTDTEVGLAGLTIRNGYDAQGYGGGIYNLTGTLTVTNSTITENTASSGGGIYNSIFEDQGYTGEDITYKTTLYNTIIAKNSTDINLNGFGTTQGFNNLTSFTGWNGLFGSNFVYDSSKPLFVDAENGDYRLAAGSQAIDAGNNSYAPSGTDLAGNVRIANETVDIGAYESTSNVPDAPTVTKTLENGKPKLTWNAVTGAVTYRVYRLNDTGTGWENVSGNVLKATTFTDATAPAGVHIYAVRAFLNDGATGSVFDNTKYVTVTAV